MTHKNVINGAKGGGLVVFGSLGTAVVQFAGVLILSRLISPGDFGLIAMVSVFVSLGNLIRDFGLPLATLEKDTLSKQESSNAFWMNALFALTAGALLAISAPAISSFYSEPRLNRIIPIMALTMVISGVGAQLQVLLARSMKYGALAFTDVCSQIAGLIGACLLASLGAGYWALVSQQIFAAGVLLVSRWIICRWIPMRYRRGFGSLSLFKAGSNYGISHFLSFLQNNADTLILGLTVGAGPLGIYNRSYQLLAAPAGRLLAPLNQVVVPTANGIKKDGGSYLAFLLKVQFYIGIALTLLFAITAGAADVLIPFVLGSGWEMAIPVFQILAVGGVFSALSNVSYWGFIINQQSRQLMHYNFVTKPLVILLIFVGSYWGLLGTASGLALGLCLSWPINLIWLSKTANFRGYSFFKNGLWIIFCGLVAAVTTRLCIEYVDLTSALISFMISVTAGFGAFLLVLCLSKSSRENLIELLVVIRKFRKF